MDNFSITPELIASVAAVVICTIIYVLAHLVINRTLMVRGSKISKKRKSYIRRIRRLARWILILIAILIVLRINGVNIGSMLAGIGIASIISGLALQDVFKDVIASFNLVIDRYFSVGDVIEFQGDYAEVVDIGLKTTKLRDIASSNIWTIANRNITEAKVLGHQLDLDIPLPYEAKISAVEAVIYSSMEKIKAIEGVEGVEYKNISDFADSAIMYRIRIFASPKLLPQIARDARVVLKLELDKNNLSVPYPQVVVHNMV